MANLYSGKIESNGEYINLIEAAGITLEEDHVYQIQLLNQGFIREGGDGSGFFMTSNKPFSMIYKGYPVFVCSAKSIGINIAELAQSSGGGGSTINNQNKTITENGEYTADTGYTGLGTVTVDVEPTLTTKSITQNGTYNASSDNVDGYSSVTVNVSGGGGVGIPREVSAQGDYQMPSSNFTFSLPSNATDLKDYAMGYAFNSCIGLTSVNLSSLTTISGNVALVDAFQNCTNLISVDLLNLVTISGNSAMNYTFQKCTGLTALSFPALTTISGSSGMQYAFSGCSKLTSINLSSLATISGSRAMQNAFQNCIQLKTLSFPALTSISFGSYTNQFNGMLNYTSGCTVHFPSNLQSVIGSWSSVTLGFGGTNTTILFDLPATT